MGNVLLTAKRYSNRTIVDEIRSLSDSSLLITDYSVAVSKGEIPGADPSSAYGRKTTSGVDSGILWADGTYALPSASGVQVSVVSTSANDAAAGTGIRTINIH